MTLTAFNGRGPVLYDEYLDDQNGATTFATGLTIDASADRCAMTGAVRHATTKTGTINIRKVHFRLGALTLNVLSGLRVQLGTIGSAAVPYQPGTMTETVTVAVGALTGSAWNSVTLGADRPVNLANDSLGDADSRWISIMWDFDPFTALDSVIVNTIAGSIPSNPGRTRGSGTGLLDASAGTFSIVSATVNNVVLECDDGTFAFLTPSLPLSAIGTTAVSTDSTARAAGLIFQFPVETVIDRIGLKLTVANGATGALVVYDSDGTTVLRSVDVDDDAVASNTGISIFSAEIAPLTCAATTNYRLVYLPSTTTDVTLHTVSVNSANMFGGMAGGAAFHYTERDSGGTWAQTTTTRPVFYMGLGSYHDGTGGGTTIAGTPMRRGMV